MKNNNAWQEIDDKLYREFKFVDFKDTFSFMTKVALIAEKQDHHPTWKNTYNVLEFWLSSHDAGDKITEKDRKLAQAIDEAAESKLK